MLSVVIAAWNEEATLPRSLASVKDLADEVVVVVDRASTDNTAAMAKKLGARVFLHNHTGIVEPMRNFSISKARGDWILLLDADEEVPATLLIKIKEVLRNPQGDFYRLPRKNLIFGRWIKSQHWWPDYVCRLFKKGSVSWEDGVHSIPFTRGIGIDLQAEENLAIVHHHYTSISQYVDRLNRYTDFQVKSLQSQGYSFNWSDLLAKPADEFIRQYFARRGYRDGVHGLALAILQTFSEGVLYLKLWQSEQFVETPIKSNQIAQVVLTKTQDWRWWNYQAKIDQSNFIIKGWYKLLRKLGL